MQIWGKVDIVFKGYGFVVNPKHLFIHELRLEFEHNINKKHEYFYSRCCRHLFKSWCHDSRITTVSFASTTKSTSLISFSRYVF